MENKKKDRAIDFLKQKNLWEWIDARGGMQVGKDELIELLVEFKENMALGGPRKTQNNMTRAKFKCDEVSQTVHGGNIKLSPVVAGSEENSRFFNYTPYGQIEIGTVNQEVIKQFIPGNNYYVDFTPAD